MKIGIIHDYQPNLGGTTEVVIRMARALKRKGHKCLLITHPKSWIREFDKKNIDLVRAQKIKITFMEYVPYTFTKVAKILSLFKRDKIELCHAHYALPYGISAYLAKQIYGVPYIVTLHGTDVHKLASMPALKAVMKLCLENADAVTTVSEYLKRTVMRKLDITKEIIVIPNFVNITRFRKKPGCGVLKKEFKIPKDNFIVTHISNYAVIKNTLIIPEIAKIVLQHHPKTTFLMIGEALCEEGYELNELKKKVSKMGLSANFRFVGRRKDIAKILNISDVSLVTSLNESFCLAALESLAVGVPVVASRVGGLPEFVKHGVNGYLVKKQNIEIYAKYILKLIKNHDLKKKLGNNAIEEVKEKYCENKVINQYIKLYESVKE